jgi:hypothetical protein
MPESTAKSLLQVIEKCNSKGVPTKLIQVPGQEKVAINSIPVAAPVAAHVSELTVPPVDPIIESAATKLEDMAPPPAAVALAAPIPVKPKAKKITYRKKDYYYQVRFDATKKPIGYLFFAMEDPDLISPIGYVNADQKGMPKGDILPVPEGL